MRARAWIFLLLAGCSRTFFTDNTTPPPTITQLMVASGAPSSSAAPVAAGPDQAVAAGDQVVVLGTHLSGVQSVWIDGVAIPPHVTSDGQLELVVPAPAPSQIGQAQAVTIQKGPSSVTAPQRLRLYAPPSVDAAPDGGGAFIPVNVPSNTAGMMVINGESFSPFPEDMVVTFGDGGATYPVLVAEPQRLLVSVDPSAAPGPQPFTIHLKPDGIPTPLSAQGLVYVWKAPQSFWLLPDQALPGERVRLMSGDGTAVASALDDMGADAGATSMDLSGSTGDMIADAGSAVATSNYMTPAAGAAAAAGGDPTRAQDSCDGGAGFLCTHKALHVVVDGVDTSQSPQLSPVDRSVSFVPPPMDSGLHQIQLQDPAGASPAAALTMLEGHIPAPSLGCEVDAGFMGDGLLAESLLHDESQGSVLIYRSGGTRVPSLLAVHPGGAVETFQGYASLPADAGVISSITPVAAGRHLVYLDVAAGGLAAPRHLMLGVDPRGKTTLATALPAAASAVIEPVVGNRYTWVMVGPPAGSVIGAQDGLSIRNWSLVGGGYPIAPPVECGTAPILESGSLDQGMATVALKCASGDLAIATLAPLPAAPPSAAPGPDATPCPTWTVLPSSDLPAGNWTAQASARRVLMVGDKILRVAIANIGGGCNDGPAPATVQRVANDPATPTNAVLAAALSPDGTQILAAVDVSPQGGPPAFALRVHRAASDGSGWRFDGSFALAGPAKAIAYDKSGSQAVILLGAPSGVVAADGGVPMGGWCLVR